MVGWLGGWVAGGWDFQQIGMILRDSGIFFNILVKMWCHFGLQGATGRLFGGFGGPRGHLGVLGVALGWPRGRPDGKNHDFAETVAYFKGSQGSPQGVRRTSSRHRPV